MRRLILLIAFSLSLMFPTYAFADVLAWSGPQMLEPEVGEGYIKWTWTEVYGVDGYIFTAAWNEDARAELMYTKEGTGINGTNLKGIYTWSNAEGDFHGPDLIATVYGQTYTLENISTDMRGLSYDMHVYAFKDGFGSMQSSHYGNALYWPPSWWAEQIRITDKTPVENAVYVPVDQKINITFAPLLNTSTVTLNNFVLKAGTEIIPTSLNYDPATGVVTMAPVVPLREYTTYNVSVSNVQSTKNEIATSGNWSFTTGQAPIQAPSNDTGGGGTSTPTAITPTTTVTPTTNITYAYTDVSNHWAKDSIQTLVNKKIIPSDVQNFYPNQEINREDFVKLLVIGMNYQPTAYTGKFTDVAADNPNAQYIQTAVDKGIVVGTSANTFSPSTPITREEIAAMFDRTLKLESIAPVELKPLSDFKDYQQVSSWAQESIQNIYSLGLMAGKTDFANVIIDPAANTTNAENATLLVRLLEKTGK